MKTKVRSLNFKWNPFTLKGEAPASLRWFPEDDFEFATKEDLEIINANPQLQKVHKAMLGGVQKKFELFNTEKKNMQTHLETLQAQVTELDGALGEWEDWAAQNKDLLTKMASDKADLTDKGRGKNRKGDEDADDRYTKLVEAINQGARNFEERLEHMGRMLKLSTQLNDLYRRNKDLDANKVLDVALKKGYSDLNKAYEDDEAYGQEILKGRVEEALKPRLEEELAKRTTNVETGSGAVPVSFELPKELPKSFTDAGDRFLAEREKEAAKL